VSYISLVSNFEQLRWKSLQQEDSLLRFDLRVFILAVIFFNFGVGVPLYATQEATQENDTQITRKQLKIAAYNSLWRLKRAIEKYGFYSASVALNVWRSNAIDAGIFDQAQYDAFKKQIYENSIENSLKCIEISFENQNYNDARICLHAWKLRSQALDTFNQDYYDQIKDRLASPVNDQMGTDKE